MMQQTECNPNLKPINSQTLFMCCCAVQVDSVFCLL